MASNASRGAAAKARTKKWLIARGYDVADMEKVHYIYTPKGRLPVKRDQWGADLIAMRVDKPGVTLIQVKSGASAIGGTFPAARRAFAEWSYPLGVGRIVIAWPPLARAPRIVRCDNKED